METRHQYVIVGAGLAGVSAIAGLRERDQNGSVLLIGREPDAPYDRPPLTKQLWFGKKTLADVTLHEQAWYAANHVELRLGRTVKHLDVAAKAVVDDAGDRHSFVKLLLATGGTPRRPPIRGATPEGVFAYRTLDDYRRLRALAGKGRSAVVLGGGFIGSEIAAGLCHAGVDVTMVFPGPYIGHRIFPEGLARAIEQVFRERGIRMLNGDVAVSIEARSGGSFTTTRNGARLPADMVVAGLGIDPEVALAQAAGLAVSDGVVANERLQTSHPDVYVAGDNALFPYAALGHAMRVEHWDNAGQQGRQAGRNMAAADEPYLHMPFFFSDLFEFGYEAVGQVDARLQTFADWQEENRKGVVYYLVDGRVRGAMMCDVWDKVEAARELIRRDAPLSSLRGAIR